MRTFLLATLLATQLLSAILSTAIAQTAAQAPVEILAHQGFRADIAALAGAPRRNEIIAALRRQIDICAEAGLSANVLAYMRSVPVRLKVFQPGEPGFNSGPGFYNGKNITLVPMLYEPANPILLHELLHAYHHDRLPDGNKNADVLAFYNRAKSPGLYPAGSYMLANGGEYFAMTASVFLHGSAARDPFTRQNLKDKQPLYYNWLEREFGRR